MLGYYQQQKKQQGRSSKRLIGINLTKPLNFDEFFSFEDALRDSSPKVAYKPSPGDLVDTIVDAEDIIPVDANGRFTVSIPHAILDTSGNTLNLKPYYVTGVNTNLTYVSGQISNGNQFYLEITGGNAQVRIPNESFAFVTYSSSQFVPVTPNKEELNVIINQADVGTEWKLYRPEANIGDVFEHNLVEDLTGFSCIRGMDWVQTNNSPHFDWSDRTLATGMGEGSRAAGASWESLIELANLTKADLWICIPHGATNDYIDNLAQLMEDDLDPSLTLYVEFSNECWNYSSAFRDQLEHCFYVGVSGNSEFVGNGLTPDVPECVYASGCLNIKNVAQGYGMETFRVCKRFKQTFTKSANYVAAWQTSASFTKDIVMDYCAPQVDSVSCAPYIYFPSNGGANPHYQRDQDLDITIARMYTEGLLAAYASVDNWIETANEYGKEMVMYEGGNHVTGIDLSFVGTVSVEDQEAYAYALVERPEFFDIYQKFDDYWEANVGNTVRCYFNHGGKHRDGNAFAMKAFTGENSEFARWNVMRWLIEN